MEKNSIPSIDLENTEWLQEKNILHTADILRIFNISERTLSRYKQKGAIPYFRLANGACIYRKSDIAYALAHSIIQPGPFKKD